MGKVLLIDGHSILNRAFYGLPDLTNAEGLHTGAVLGFLNIILRIMDEEQPEYVTVAFDTSAKTFRHQMYDAYKGTRKGMPEELREQIPLMKEVLDAMGIVRVECEGLEADDILGTLAAMYERAGESVLLLSGDRDLLQAATDKTVILLPHTKAHQTQMERYDAAEVARVWGVTPKQFIDLKALMGDSSDNVPGVPKVGEKTAKELMNAYHSIEGIYEHIEDIPKKAVKASLIENRALCDLSKALVTIRTDAEFPYDKERARSKDVFTHQALEVFKRLNFRKLIGRFTEQGVQPLQTQARDVSAQDVEVVTTNEEMRNVFRTLCDEKHAEVAYAFLAEEDELYGLALCTNAHGKPDTAHSYASWYFPVRTEGTEVTPDALRQEMDALSAHCNETEDLTLVSADLKSGYRFFTPAEVVNCDAGNRVTHADDIILTAYLLNPLKNDYTVADVAIEYLNEVFRDRTERFGKKVSYADVATPDLAAYAADIACVCLRSRRALRDRLKESDMEALYTGIELPLTYILYDMERLGIIALPDALKEYGDALTGRIAELEEAITRAAGVTFNINSPKQLGEVLFERMQLPHAKKTKTGYSTAADVLEKLSNDYPVVRDILEYRGLTKLKSTYADGLSDYIGDDGRIHTVFHQTITATGRLSSTDPNLQNIPMRTDLGRRIRKVFVPEKGYVFADADYSQIELRILAHMSGDEELIAAYHEGRDIHRITAAKVFHVPFEEVTDLQRRNAKAVNFGIVYGISAFGLSEDLSISRKEATAYIEQYFATYPGIKKFLDECVERARTRGYSVTMFQRRRPIPELSGSNFMQRQFGERVAMNAPIQGTAADIMKIAMINVWRRLKREGLRSRLILQIHDELLIETAEDEITRVTAILEEEMTTACDLKVPLTVESHTGSNWYEAK